VATDGGGGGGGGGGRGETPPSRLPLPTPLDSFSKPARRPTPPP